MKRGYQIITFAALSLLLAPAASADQESWINWRQAKQDYRVDRGAESGTLTENETRLIERRDTRIDAWEDRALADGDMSNREYAGLNRALNHQSRFIYRQKHGNNHR